MATMAAPDRRRAAAPPEHPDGGRTASRRSRTTSRSTTRSSARCIRRSAWFVGARHRDPLPAHRRGGVDLPDLQGARRRRLPPAGDVGRVHHHLRVLGRYRPRGHADLGDSLSVPRRLPHDDLSVRRGDDGVRRHDGGTVPDPAPRAAVEVLLADSVSELAAHLAAVQEPARVGRVRDPHVPHDLGDVPLHRTDSRHRGAARSRDESDPQADLRACSRSAGGTRIASGGTSRARICSSPRSRRRSCSRCTPSFRSTSRWR